MVSILMLFASGSRSGAEALKISNQFSLEKGEGGYCKSAMFLINGSKTGDFSGSYQSNVSYTKSDKKLAAEDELASKIAVGKSLTIQNHTYDQEGDVLAKVLTHYTPLDGTNALVHTEFHHLAENPASGCHCFYFMLENLPPGTTCEVTGADGKVQVFDLKTQEVSNIKTPRKVAVKKDHVLTVMEPGKDTFLEIRDQRIQDISNYKLQISLRSKKEFFSKGEKQILEGKFRMMKVP